jgi:hypothetical protein
VLFDTNYWKSFVHSRLAVSMGVKGCLSLFGETPDPHRLLAERLTSEYRAKTEARGRTVDEWKVRPERGGQGNLVGLPHFPARAKRGSFLTQSGGPSQLELFDDKPGLVEWA